MRVFAKNSSLSCILFSDKQISNRILFTAGLVWPASSKTRIQALTDMGGGGGGGLVSKQTVMLQWWGGVKHKDLFLPADLRVLYIPNSRIKTTQTVFASARNASFSIPLWGPIYIDKTKKTVYCLSSQK